MLRKPENNFLRAIYAGVQKFFSGPIAGLTNQPPVRDFRPGAPLVLGEFITNTGHVTSRALLRRIVHRECHGFTNPYGLRSRVVTGTGTGWQFPTLQKPVPVTRVTGITGVAELCD